MSFDAFNTIIGAEKQAALSDRFSSTE